MYQKLADHSDHSKVFAKFEKASQSYICFCVRVSCLDMNTLQ